MQGLAEPGPRGEWEKGNKWSSSWGLVLLLLILVPVHLASTWIYIRRGRCHSCQRTSPSRGRARWVGRRRWRLSRRRQFPRKMAFYFPCIFFGEKTLLFFYEYGFVSVFTAGYASSLLGAHSMLPYDASSVCTPKWALWEKGWLTHCKTMFSPCLDVSF